MHGEAQLSIAADGDELWVELQSPAMNILGFEHYPDDGKQWAAVHNARRQLDQIGNLLDFPGAGCRQQAVELAVPFEQQQRGETPEHTEFHGQYKLRCSAIDRLKTVRVKLFDVFSGFESVKVRWLHAGGQGAADIDSRSPLVTIN